MVDDYTPTTEDVEAIARVLAAIESRKGMKSLDEVLAYQAEKWRRHTYEAERLLDEMRPWLAAHDRQVKAEALREHAERIEFWNRDSSPRVLRYSTQNVVADLEDFATRIEQGENE